MPYRGKLSKSPYPAVESPSGRIAGFHFLGLICTSGAATVVAKNTTPTIARRRGKVIWRDVDVFIVVVKSTITRNALS